MGVYKQVTIDVICHFEQNEESLPVVLAEILPCGQNDGEGGQNDYLSSGGDDQA